MIKYIDTTVFNVDAQTIANTVNCVGIMGAGLALECKLRFPEMYEDYVERCKQKEVQIGKPYIYRSYGSPWILNFPTKYHWKYPSKIAWIEQGLEYFVATYKQNEVISIAFPKPGCSHGGLDWDDVKVVMASYLEDIDIQSYICLDEEQEARGIEKVMVDSINNIHDQDWILSLRIRRDIAARITRLLPIRRFYELLKIEGVGRRSYERIFRFFYEKACILRKTNTQTMGSKQLELFK